MILALDYGEKRIGVAVSDESEKIATALPYLSNKSEIKRISNKDYPKGTDPQKIKEDRKALKIQSKIELRKVFNIICHLINTYYPDKIIVGLPKTIDKETNEWIEGHQAKKIRNFMKKFEQFLISKKIVCEIIFIDETMTSKQAEENLREMNLTNDKVREKIDSESARILLQEYLDK